MKVSCWPSSWEASWVTSVFRRADGLGGGRGVVSRGRAGRRGGLLWGWGGRRRAGIGCRRQVQVQAVVLAGRRDGAGGLGGGCEWGCERGRRGGRIAHDHRGDLAIGLAGHFVQFGTELLHRFLQ